MSARQAWPGSAFLDIQTALIGSLTQRCACLRYTLPLAELGGNFYDSLKSITSGYASFDYEAGPQRRADLVRLDLLLNGEPVDALARVVHRSALCCDPLRGCLALTCGEQKRATAAFVPQPLCRDLCLCSKTHRAYLIPSAYGYLSDNL